MLYIMRHGTTDWNVCHKLQGRSDVPLNAQGRALAAAAGEAHRGTHFDVCYCSPLIRARETAELFLAGRDIPVITDDRLMEMGFGEYEGSDYSFSGDGGPLGTLFTAPEKYTAPPGGAESLDSLFARTGELLADTVLPLVNEGKDVLIVAHGAVNSSIICRIRDIPRERFWSAGIKNCELMRLM